MNPSTRATLRGIAAFASAMLLFAHARSATLLLDDFVDPVPAQSLLAPSQQYVVSTPGVFAGVAGTLRDGYYWVYQDSAAGGAAASIGAGAVNVAASAQAFGELGLGYGAYGLDLANINVQGPLLGLDVSSYVGFQAVFSSAMQDTNLIVGLYTSAPTGGLSFWTGEIFAAPTVAGGPLVGTFLFNDPTAAMFNFGQVDGIVFIVDRATSLSGNNYSLSKLQFIQAVPEPAMAWTLLASMVAVGFMARRRARDAARLLP